MMKPLVSISIEAASLATLNLSQPLTKPILS